MKICSPFMTFPVFVHAGKSETDVSKYWCTFCSFSASSIWIYISLWRTNNLEESSSLPSLPAGPAECLFNVSLSLHSILVISVQSKPHCSCISCMFFQYNRWIINSPIKQNTRQCLLLGTTFCPDRGKLSSTYFALMLYLQHTNSADPWRRFC